ncbi:cation diffusion facilitator family transporter [Paraburkholderia phenazinium]|uniref:Cation diffusion facilitator family transporter n=2 Tax=Paraburkholderia phenazinium TaxID=60549 RepID=A0A1G8ARV9_9BURK|nr:cation diffusion facilitator family transporter [Paraburkholderia phenazinium]
MFQAAGSPALSHPRNVGRLACWNYYKIVHPMTSLSERPRQSRGSSFKAAYVSATLNAALMTMQIVIGHFAHSDGLVADGIHTLSDLAADGVVIAVLFLGASTASGRRAAGADGSFHASLATLLIGVLLIGTAVEMLWHSIEPATILSVSKTVRISALLVAVFVMLAKETLFRYMRAEAKLSHSSVLLASAWHARVDAVSALVATLGILGSMAGVPILDHVAAGVIGLMILRMGYSNCWTALKDLAARPLGTTARQ